MHILHFTHSLYIPVLPGDIRILLLARNRLRRNQAPAPVIYGNAAQIAFIGFIQKIHSFLNGITLIREIILFYDIIINRIRNLPHAYQIILQIFPGLLHQLFRTVYCIFPGQGGKPAVHHNAQDQHDRNGYDGKHQHDRRLYPSGPENFKFTEIFIFHMSRAPFCIWKGIHRTAS